MVMNINLRSVTVFLSHEVYETGGRFESRAQVVSNKREWMITKQPKARTFDTLGVWLHMVVEPRDPRLSLRDQTFSHGMYPV